MGGARVGSDFERALSDEVLASEIIRMRVLAATLAVLLAAVELLLFLFRHVVEPLARQPLSLWLPLYVLGPFVLYECIATLVLQRRRRRGAGVLTPLRFANAVIETSLPSVFLWAIAQYWGPTVALGAWPSMLYFIFIVAATLRLGFVLPVFTGAVAALGYMIVVALVLPLSTTPDDPVRAPLYHLTKAGIMLVAGVVAGLVAMRLRHTFRRAFDEAAARERVTNLFGQHVARRGRPTARAAGGVLRRNPRDRRDVSRHPQTSPPRRGSGAPRRSWNSSTACSRS